jgi:putative heme transporter
VTNEPEALITGELPRVSPDDTGGPPRPRRYRPFRVTIKLLLFLLVIYFAAVTLVPGLRKAMNELRSVNPALLVLGFVLEIAALYCYTMLTRVALGQSARSISSLRLFRIQMSTKALSSIVPGGSAAGSALGFRLMTLSGVDGPSAGFALATAGVSSAIVLNLLFWSALIVSIPIRGVNELYAGAAVAGVVLLLLAGMLVFGLMEGQGLAERILRWLARRLRLNENRAAAGVRHVGVRLEELASDRSMLARVAGWSAANWLLDAAALWVFLRAFGATTDVDALLVSFCLANVLAVIPITPGGLGIIDSTLPVALVWFGLTSATAALGVASYRVAQFFFPILLGGALYASLRVGPWSIERRERLERLRVLARESESNSENALDFSARFLHRRRLLSSFNEDRAGYPAEGDGADDHGRPRG